MRWDVMKGLVYGYTGHTWFLYQVHPAHGLTSSFFSSWGSWDAATQAQFDIASDLNHELVIIGRSIALLTSTDVRFIPATTLYTPRGTQTWSRGAGSDPFITNIEAINESALEFQDVSIGFFEDDAGQHYIMLQNPTHASADWPIMVADEADFRVEFDFATAAASLDTSRIEVLNNRTGSIETRVLSSTGPSTAAIQFTLDAGDAVLFKYATGGSFAQQAAD